MSKLNDKFASPPEGDDPSQEHAKAPDCGKAREDEEDDGWVVHLEAESKARVKSSFSFRVVFLEEVGGALVYLQEGSSASAAAKRGAA